METYQTAFLHAVQAVHVETWAILNYSAYLVLTLKLSLISIDVKSQSESL